MIKTSKIKKLDDKYRVVSEDGKNLGVYNTREEAEKRLKQVEYFKHKDKNDAKDSKKKKRVSLDVRPEFFTSNFDYGEPGLSTGLYRGPVDRFKSVTDFLEKSRKKRKKRKKDLDIYSSIVAKLTNIYFIKLSQDQISGGLADKFLPQDFDIEQLKQGIKVEMEHTNDPELAREIAMDHLTESPQYYIKLKTIETHD